MNTKTFCRNLSILLLALCVSFLMAGQGYAQSNIWTENFDSYANTAALKTAYVQCNNGGARLAQPATTNDIALANDPDGITPGKVLQFIVNPTLSSQASNYYLFYWFYTGTGTSNPFPSAIFRNGTDFNVRYDVYTTTFNGINHKVGGVATCMGSWTQTDPTAVFVGNRGHSSNCGFPSWTQLFAGFRGSDARLGNANINMTNGNACSPIVALNPEPQTTNAWYSCRLVVDWPNNTITTNQTATCTFKIWPRGTAEPGSATCLYGSWPGDAAIELGASGAKTGDGYGVYGMFQDPGAGGAAYNQYIDNVVFQDSLTPVEDWIQY